MIGASSEAFNDIWQTVKKLTNCLVLEPSAVLWKYFNVLMKIKRTQPVFEVFSHVRSSSINMTMLSKKVWNLHIFASKCLSLDKLEIRYSVNPAKDWISCQKIEQKNRSKMSQSASQNIQTTNLFKTKRQESFWTCAKKPAKLDNLNNYHKQQFSPE